jgi:hypothetical protein
VLLADLEVLGNAAAGIDAAEPRASECSLVGAIRKL